MKTNLPILRGGARCPQRAFKTFVRSQTSVLRTSRSTSILCLLSSVLCLLLSAPAAHAQWQTVNYTLRGGWNSIYLHGEASHATIETLLADRPEVISIWRWNPNPSQIQFSSSSLIPTNGTPEWTTWTRNGTTNTLTALTGQAAYLVECMGAVTDTYQLSLVQRALPPRSTWVRNGANLLGFPSRLSGSYPTMANFFATFPVATATNSKIYKYAGGPLGAGNPINIFSTAGEPLDRTQAYWFEAAVVGDFYAPIEVSPSNLDGLSYGRNGSLITVRVRNRTAAAVTLTAAPLTSAAAPAGQDQVTGPVPLTYRTFNTSTNAYEFRAVDAGNPVAVVVAPQSSVELSFGVDRALITGAANTLYASLLRVTDGGNLMDVYLPVSARVTSLSGLWIGDVTVSDVQAKVPGVTGTATGRTFPLRVILHVDDLGIARLLSQVFIGKLAASPYNVGLATLESGLKATDLATARRFSAAHLPPETVIAGAGSVALGQTLVRTINLDFKAPTNPFVHTYHPDHDNRSARFDAALTVGVESPTVSRACSFNFTTSPPAGSGSSPQGWGSTVIGGTYSETITGIHKTPTTVTGLFELRRVSELGTLTTN